MGGSYVGGERGVNAICAQRTGQGNVAASHFVAGVVGIKKN